MFHRCFVAAAIAAPMLSAPAGVLAADIAGGPPVYPPSIDCAVIDLSAPVPKSKHHRLRTDYVRVFTVAPYDPRCPQGQPTGIYVPPQTAYLASSPTRYTECVWPCRDEVHRNWYDGKLWYYNAGTPNRPDVFMIIERE